MSLQTNYKLLTKAVCHPSIRDRIPIQHKQILSLRYFANDRKNEEETTEQYLRSLGYNDAEVQNGMKDALKSAFGNNITVSHLKSLGKDGEQNINHSIIQHYFRMSNSFFHPTIYKKDFLHYLNL